MGQQKQPKVDVQFNKIKKVFIKLLESNIAILEFQATLTNNEDEKLGLDRWVDQSKKGINIIQRVKHYDILISLYNMYVNNKESFYVSLCNSITHESTIQHWDKTEKGYKEFLEMERAAREDYANDMKEKKENLDFIAKARKEGKKVEMLYKDGKIKPVIVEEGTN